MLNMCIRYYKMVCTHIPTSIRNYIIGIHCSQCIIRQITIIRLIADLDTRIMLKGPLAIQAMHKSQREFLIITPRPWRGRWPY